jgi:hypothetical protein
VENGRRLLLGKGNLLVGNLPLEAGKPLEEGKGFAAPR